MLFVEILSSKFGNTCPMLVDTFLLYGELYHLMFGLRFLDGNTEKLTAAFRL